MQLILQIYEIARIAATIYKYLAIKSIYFGLFTINLGAVVL